ncbi:transporter [Pseudoxanthomonas dokdonensis]|uniref:Acetate kinase n=1 Tax=Pseudoxanthomonas dokdonensis TaxID=344882 RepID=A0A0R0CVG6_9GAMM|nr:transporter [Pseudoxanthomonas dokdonensis]KRG70498.1 acetate kinase [Pseudoxanthomonas dokdonensis]
MVALGLLAVPPAMAQQAGGEDARLNELQRQINEQTSKLAQMRQSLQEQEAGLAQLQQSLNEEILASARARGAPAPVLLPSLSQGVGYAPSATVGAATPAPAAVAQQQAPEPNAEVPRQRVGQAPESDSRPPEVAQIFDQPGVLTPPGKFVLEPSLQYGYYANDRVALVGYTVIPAILIGLIDVRQVKTTTGVSTLTTRYGVGKRFELELKLPYVYVNTDTISREVFTGSAQDRVFNVNGSGVGDVEMTARYQINQGGPDKPFYIGWLRYKSRTGRDPFEVVTDCVTRCVANTTGTGLPLESPTGSGFEAIQPGVTWLFPSDPVVFFGSLSYLHNFKRSNVTRTLLLGAEENIGDIEAGDIIGFNLGLGLALNEKASISMGYDQSIIDRTKQNGKDIPGSARITQGTLLLGGTYRFNDNVSFNMALGAGLTRDTPDLTVTARVPITF